MIDDDIICNLLDDFNHKCDPGTQHCCEIQQN